MNLSWTYRRCVRGIIDGIEGLSEATKELLYEFDPLIATALRDLPEAVIKGEGKNAAKTNEDIDTSEVDLGWKKSGEGFKDWEKCSVKVNHSKVSNNFTCLILSEDDLIEEDSFFDGVKKWLEGSTFGALIFPMKHTFQFRSVEMSEKVMKELRLVKGLAFPDSYNTGNGFELQSDESLTQMFFYGIAAPLLAAQQQEASESIYGPFEVDLPMHNFEVRKGFRPYGARIHFHENQAVSAIFDYAKEKLYLPGDEDGWQAAKFLAKTTAIVFITIREHLVWTHLILSNSLSRCKTVELPPSHALRRLLIVFSFRGNYVNTAAFSSFVPETSLLHRGSWFEYPSLKEIFDQSYLQSTIFQPFGKTKFNTALTKLSKKGQFPYVKEGQEYYQIVESFVTEWLDKAGDEANDEYAMNFYEAVRASSKGQSFELPPYESQHNMVDLISQLIFTVTAYHDLVGGVVDYNTLPNR